ncbi:MAG TPA: glycoside hydrolase family 3 C-terminal domain-containing protein [Caproiciproducens sp.]|nr:glycoside hydrolase family 3 C-terminal domain-containing protein [Caproiciproducens sp.]
MRKVTSEESSVGSQRYRDLAKTLVEESLVLLKNDRSILPIKKGTKIFVTGPAANDVGVQCGGWTITWLGSSDAANNGHKWIPKGKTILDGLNELANEYNLTIITDPKEAAKANMTSRWQFKSNHPCQKLEASDCSLYCCRKKCNHQ